MLKSPSYSISSSLSPLSAFTGGTLFCAMLPDRFMYQGAVGMRRPKFILDKSVATFRVYQGHSPQITSNTNIGPYFGLALRDRLPECYFLTLQSRNCLLTIS